MLQRMTSYETTPHPDEGKVVGTKIMVGGEWHKVNKLMDYMINQGPAVGEKFSKLSKRDQADVLKGRATLETVGRPLPPACPRREWSAPRRPEGRAAGRTPRNYIGTAPAGRGAATRAGRCVSRCRPRRRTSR